MSDAEAISNQSLHAKQMVFEQKLETHAQMAVEFRVETGATLKEIRQQLNRGDTRFALLDQHMVGIEKALEGIHATIKEATAAGQAERDKQNRKIENNATRLSGLEKAASFKDGERSAWDRIMASKPVIWLFGMFSAAALAVGSWLAGIWGAK